METYFSQKEATQKQRVEIERLTLVNNLLSSGFSIEKIVAITGMELSVIQELVNHSETV